MHFLNSIDAAQRPINCSDAVVTSHTLDRNLFRFDGSIDARVLQIDGVRFVHK
jgi:hypothetical protein